MPQSLIMLLWIATFQVIGYGFGQLTQANMQWYHQLIHSSLTPPPVAFGIAWTLLYVLLAIAGYNYWQSRHQPALRPARYCFFAQLLLNWAWTPIFFHAHALHAGFVCIVLMISLTTTALWFSRKLTWAWVCLTPYWLWLVFAAYLNGMIVYLN